MLKIDDSDAKISFYEHAGTLSIGSIFRKPKKRENYKKTCTNLEIETYIYIMQ